MNQLTTVDTKRLLELLENELDLYIQIRKLTEKQAQLLSKDDIDAFNGSLEKRAELIEKIKGLHQDSDPLMQSYVSVAKSAANKDEGIEKLREQIRREIAECSRLNDENMAAMKDKVEEHTRKIDEKSAQRKGIGGYAQAVPNTPEIFDKKS